MPYSITLSSERLLSPTFWHYIASCLSLILLPQLPDYSADQYQYQLSPSVLSMSLQPCLWTSAHQASLSITNSQSLPKLMSIKSVMPSNHLILCCPLLLLPSIFPSIRVFSNESAVCIRWPKYWTFSFNISSCNEYSGLISFRMDWLDLLVVQGTLKSLLQHHSSKAILQIPTEKFSFHCFISIQKISRLRIIFCLKFLNVGLAVQF